MAEAFIGAPFSLQQTTTKEEGGPSERKDKVVRRVKKVGRKEAVLIAGIPL
jgi:hypothetical protein